MISPLSPEETAELRRKVVDAQLRLDRSKPFQTTYWINGPLHGLLTMEPIQADGSFVGWCQTTRKGPEQAIYKVEGDQRVFHEWANMIK